MVTVEKTVTRDQVEDQEARFPPQDLSPDQEQEDVVRK